MSKLDMNTACFGTQSFDKEVSVFYDPLLSRESVMFRQFNLHFDELAPDCLESVLQTEELKKDPFYQFGVSLITTIVADTTCLPLGNFEAIEDPPEDPPTQFSRWFVHTLASSKLTDEQIGGLQRQFAALFRRLSTTAIITSKQMLHISLGFCSAHPQRQLTSDAGLQAALRRLFVNADARGGLVTFTGDLLELFSQGKVWPMVVEGKFHLRALVDAEIHQVLFRSLVCAGQPILTGMISYMEEKDELTKRMCSVGLASNVLAVATVGAGRDQVMIKMSAVYFTTDKQKVKRGERLVWRTNYTAKPPSKAYARAEAGPPPPATSALPAASSGPSGPPPPATSALPAASSGPSGPPPPATSAPPAASSGPSDPAAVLGAASIDALLDTCEDYRRSHSTIPVLSAIEEDLQRVAEASLALSVDEVAEVGVLTNRVVNGEIDLADFRALGDQIRADVNARRDSLREEEEHYRGQQVDRTHLNETSLATLIEILQDLRDLL